MAENWPAERIARYDQSRPDASAKIDELVEILRSMTAKVGEHQAVADIAALVSGEEPAELAGLLAVALQRLAG